MPAQIESGSGEKLNSADEDLVELEAGELTAALGFDGVGFTTGFAEVFGAGLGVGFRSAAGTPFWIGVSSAGFAGVGGTGFVVAVATGFGTGFAGVAAGALGADGLA